MKARVQNGSVTVEAAFILGFVMMLFLAVFSMTFYLHDRAVLRETAAYYAEAMRHMAEEPVDLDGRLESWRLEEQNVFRTNGYAEYKDPGLVEYAFRQTAAQRMLMSEVTSTKAVFEGRKIRLSYAAAFRLPGGAVIAGITGIGTEWSDEIQISLRMDPEEFIRLCRGVIWRKKEE